MAGNVSSDPKRQWLHEVLHINFAVAGAADATGGGGNDTDLENPNDAEAPAKPVGDPPKAKPAAPSADHDPRSKLKHAEEELDSATKGVVAKEESLHEAEEAVAKAHSELDAAKATAEQKTDEYYEAESEALQDGASATDDDLPRPMQPDCVPEPGKIAGPKHHVLCKTHGHVLNTESKTIIAKSPADYDARHPVPRPIESDCKIVRGKLPYAPANIVLCEPHGHVIDEAKKQIIANSAAVYLSAHPGQAHPPKSADKKGAATPSTAAHDMPSPPAATPAPPDKKPAGGYSGEWNARIDSANELRDIIIDTAILDDGRFSYSVFWNYTDKPQRMPPPMARVEIDLANAEGKPVQQMKEDYHAVAAGGHYSATGSVPLPSKAFDGEAPAIYVDIKIVSVLGEAVLFESHSRIEVSQSD